MNIYKNIVGSATSMTAKNIEGCIANATAKLLFGKIELLLIKFRYENEELNIEEIISHVVNEAVDLFSEKMISIIIKNDPKLAEPEYGTQYSVLHLSSEEIARVNLCNRFREELMEIHQDKIRGQGGKQVMH